MNASYDCTLDFIYSILGICPQHNVLFDLLTVREHLVFFTMLKGVTNKLDVEMEVDRMLEGIGLDEKCDAYSSSLSGGMKRKLSVGIALVGGSKVGLFYLSADIRFSSL